MEAGRSYPALREVMTTDVVTVGPEDSLREVVETLAEHRISGAPVVAGGRVVGVISASDILAFEARHSAGDTGTDEDDDDERWRAATAEWTEPDHPAPAYFAELWSEVGDEIIARFSEARGASDRLDAHDVEELMTREVRALPPDTTLDEAARYILDHGIHRVLVMDGEALAGLVTTTDFVRAIARRRF